MGFPYGVDVLLHNINFNMINSMYQYIKRGESYFEIRRKSPSMIYKHMPSVFKVTKCISLELV